MELDWDKSDVKAKAAASWEISDDNTVFTFHLKDAKFHNGDPVTAESFKRGWQRLVDPSMATPGEIGYHLSPVMGYDRDDFRSKKFPASPARTTRPSS